MYKVYKKDIKFIESFYLKLLHFYIENVCRKYSKKVSKICA